MTASNTPHRLRGLGKETLAAHLPTLVERVSALEEHRNEKSR